MMSTRKLRFAIFGNVYQPKKSVSIQKILACLSQYEAEVFIEREFYTFITEGQQMSLKGVNVFDNNIYRATSVFTALICVMSPFTMMSNLAGSSPEAVSCGACCPPAHAENIATATPMPQMQTFRFFILIGF